MSKIDFSEENNPVISIFTDIITISRYINQVPPLIHNHVSEKEVEIAQKKLIPQENDWMVLRLFKGIYNETIALGVNTDKMYLPHYFNSTSLLLVFAMLEEASKNIGKVAQKSVDSKLSIKDISENNDVKRVKIYLEKHVGLDLSAIKTDWDKICNFMTVRNSIIHHNSGFDKNNTNKSTRKLINHVNKDCRISVKKDRFFITDNEYAKDFLETSQKYLWHICIKLVEKTQVS